MFKNLSSLLFLSMLMMGSLMAISANSWLGVWMGLEINLLSFIPMLTKKNNLNNSEAALNYFLVQAFASTIILFSMIMNMILFNTMYFITLSSDIMSSIPIKLIVLTLMLKMGAAPFHFWFPNVMENIMWMSGLILMTWQKLAPMMILAYLMDVNFLLVSFILCSTMVGAIGGLNQNSLRKLLAFSSINHIGWMITATMFNENLWLTYFLIYSILNFSIIMMFNMYNMFYLAQMYSLFMKSPLIKFSLLTAMMSLGGLPPFLGFLPKWLIIQSLIFMKMNLINLFMICMSLITLFYYLKISFAAFMMNYNEFSWNYSNLFSKSSYSILMLMNVTSIFTFFFTIEVIYLY